MNEMIIRIRADEKISVEENEKEIKRVKYILPETLVRCISASMENEAVFSGILPKNCIAFNQYKSGNKAVVLLFQEKKADITYYGTEYKNFPLPQLVFGFIINKDGRIINSSLGVTDYADIIKPSMQMYKYPFSNVREFHLCTGNNAMPICSSLYKLASIPYFILSMPNNNDYFCLQNNRKDMALRELLEHLKDKTPEYYYSDILIPMRNETLNSFFKKWLIISKKP